MNKYTFGDAAQVAKLVPDYFEEGEDLAEDYSYYLVKTDPEGKSTVVCRDHGEPEDANFGRDFAAIPGIIMELQRERDALAERLASCSGQKVDTRESQR